MSQGTPRSVNRGHLTSVFSGQVTSALTRERKIDEPLAGAPYTDGRETSPLSP